MIMSLEEYQNAEKEGYIKRCPKCNSLEMEPASINEKDLCVLYVCHDCHSAMWFNCLKMKGVIGNGTR